MVHKINDKLNIATVITTWIISIIVSIFLGCFGYDFVYYLIGVFTGLLNFGLMIKTNRRIVRAAENDPDNAAIFVKRQTAIGFLLRLFVFIGVFLAIFYKELGNENGMWNLLIAFSGYATLKLSLIISYLIFRKKVHE